MVSAAPDVLFAVIAGRWHHCYLRYNSVAAINDTKLSREISYLHKMKSLCITFCAIAARKISQLEFAYGLFIFVVNLNYHSIELLLRQIGDLKSEARRLRCRDHKVFGSHASWHGVCVNGDYSNG